MIDNYIKFENEVTFFETPESLIEKRRYKRAILTPNDNIELYSFIYHGKHKKDASSYNYTLVINGISDRIIRTDSFQNLFEKDHPLVWAGVIKERSEIKNLLLKKLKKLKK